MGTTENQYNKKHTHTNTHTKEKVGLSEEEEEEEEGDGGGGGGGLVTRVKGSQSEGRIGSSHAEPCSGLPLKTSSAPVLAFTKTGEKQHCSSWERRQQQMERKNPFFPIP